MAKQAVSGVERHVEKIVTGLTAAVLLGAIVHYLLKSPRTVDVPRLGPQGPGQVDPAVNQLARRLKTSIDEAKHKPYEGKNPVDQLVRRIENPLGNLPPALPSPLAWRQPTVPEVAGTSAPDKVKLATVIAPEGIAVSSGRTTIRPLEPVPLSQSPKQAPDKQEDHIWVAVAAEFDVTKQSRAFEAYGYLRQRSQVLLANVLLQRRQLLGDGTWDAWNVVKTFSPHLGPELPKLELVEEDGVWSIGDKEKKNEELKALSTLIGRYQFRIIRPLPPPKLAGDEWVPPPLSNVDVAQALQAMRKKASGPGRTDAEEKELEPIELKTARDIKKVLGQLGNLQKQKRYEAAIKLAEDYKTRAEQLDGRLRQRVVRSLDKFIETQKKALTEKPEDQKQDQEPGMTGRLALWAFDTSALPGQVYQYRIAVQLLNRYAGVPNLLANPQDARQVALGGQWSAPSGPVHVPETTRFFLTKVAGGQATVEIWKWQKGHWREGKFTVGVGEAIGEKKKVRGANKNQEQVDFSTNAIVVELQNNRKFRYTTGKNAIDGFKTIEEGSTAALVYRDASGRLGERIELLDARDTWRRDRKKELRKKGPRSARRPQ